MQTPIQITLRDDIPHSEAIETHVHEKAENLQQYAKNLIACHVVVELSSKNHNSGNLYNTRVTITVPGKELVSTMNEDPNMYTSIKIAFDDLIRQVEAYNEQIHRKVKHHQPELSGKIVRLFDAENYGFIESTTGSEYYFNANNLVTGQFDKLKVGMAVHFIEFMGDEGMQAHRVKLLDRPYGD